MDTSLGKITKDTLDELARIVQYGPTNEDRLIAAELILDTYKHISQAMAEGSDPWIPDEWTI